MTAIELHPEFLTQNGEKQFAVLPYREFVRLQEWLEDAEDLLELRAAQKEESDAPTISLEQLKKELNLE